MALAEWRESTCRESSTSRVNGSLDDKALLEIAVANPADERALRVR